MRNLRLAEGVEDLISSGEIRRRVEQMGSYYSHRYGDEEVVVLTVMQGAAVFASDLTREIRCPNLLSDYVDIASMDGAETSGKAEILREPKIPMEGRTVLVIEDIDHTRTTLAALLPHLREQHRPKQLDLAVLLNKPLEEKAVELDAADDVQYGFQIASRFVVGYGLDWKERYRSLPHVSTAHNVGGQAEEEQLWVPTIPDETRTGRIEPATLNPALTIIPGIG